ncbi:protein kinase [Verrucomicrobiaceae bacterium N1E253]|uniref:Protein kinase n=1 Tax=Oceaniferula marina TaxID=2748318 RepID=A0A851GFZ5_9BACT|nr:protein kinase [Oceaniferula marina]NWK56129.1 protein kinase [Oceaniferula marina]
MTTAIPDTDFTPPSIEEIAALLPAYEILSFIAKGGMGAVYMANHISLDRKVAIKVLPRHFGEDEEFRTSFESEAKSMARLNHPNLVGIYDFGQVDGLLYIIMEMVEGPSLFDATHGNVLAPEEAAELTLKICQGLANAHEQGLLHRDVKPANILIDQYAEPKIGDFGLARPVTDHDKDSAFGTPGYTAPEVVQNPYAVDQSTDLYAVGVILYELITSELPSIPYQPVTHTVPCSPEFDRIISKAMHPIPGKRYRSAEEMIDDLKPLLNATPAPTQTTALITPSPAPTGPRPASQPTYTTRPQSEAGHLVRNIAVIAILLVAIVASWKGYQAVKENRRIEQARIDEKKAEDERLRKLEIEKKRKAKALAELNKAPQEVEIVETPEESLQRLKPFLVNGQRAEMPKGSVTRMGKTRLFIDEKMTWHEAQQFCAEYGGHLAVTADDQDLSLLSNKIPSNTSVWLGAGTAGKNNWSWIDGSPWNLNIRSTSKSYYVSVDDIGSLTPKPASAKNSFFIEWKTNGEQQASFEQQLKRCAEQIRSGNAYYPPGTISYSNQHYLLVKLDADWNQAQAMAELAGASLVVPSDPDENEWLISSINAQLPNGSACWIGGMRKENAAWHWASGETWSFAKWAPSSPAVHKDTKAACCINGNEGWSDLPNDNECSYFMIEWNPATRAAPEQSKTTIVSNDVEALQNICKKSIRKIFTTHDKKFEDNIAAYKRELGLELRRLPNNQRLALTPTYTLLVDHCSANRIPYYTDLYTLNKNLAKTVTYRADKQKSYETSMILEVEQLRNRYHQELKKLITSYNEKGLKSKAVDVSEEITSTKTYSVFVTHISDGDLAIVQGKKTTVIPEEEDEDGDEDDEEKEEVEEPSPRKRGTETY